MPRRSPPGNRDSLEAALGPDLLGALHDMCGAFDVPPRDWTLHPVIARPWEVLAARRLADRLQAERAIGADRALDEAARVLGISPETLKSRWRRAV